MADDFAARGSRVYIDDNQLSSKFPKARDDSVARPLHYSREARHFHHASPILRSDICPSPVLFCSCFPLSPFSLSLSLFSLFFRIQGGDTGRCSKRGARRSTHVKGFNYCGDLAWTVALGAPDHLIAVFIGSFSFILLHLSGESSVAFISAHEPADHGFCRGSQPPVVRVRVISLVLVLRSYFTRLIVTCVHIYVYRAYIHARKYIRRRGNGKRVFFLKTWLLADSSFPSGIHRERGKIVENPATRSSSITSISFPGKLATTSLNYNLLLLVAFKSVC